MDEVLFDQEEQKLCHRATELASTGDKSYAIFLCHELLQRNPDHLEARQLQLNLRKNGIPKTKLQKLIILFQSLMKLIFFSFQFKKKKKECFMALDALLDVYPKWEMVWRLMSRLAIQLEYFNTTVFCIENIDQNQRKVSDIIRLGEAYLGCGHFAGAVEVANFILDRDPENIKARDLLWQSSIDDTLEKQDSVGVSSK
jgi:tetratricopeptide (TPR) repeat protein